MLDNLQNNDGMLYMGIDRGGEALYAVDVQILMIHAPCGAMLNLIEAFNCKYCIISIPSFEGFHSAEIRTDTQ